MRKLLLFVFTLFIIGNTANSQLVSHWKFEDNANDETGTNNGTLVNGDATLYVDGVSGKAFDVGSGNDMTHIAVPDDPSIDFDSTDSWTLSAFIDIPDINSTSDLAIFWKGWTKALAHPDTNGLWYSMVFKGNQARIVVDDNVNKTQLGYSDAHLKLNNGWNHVAGVRDRADTMMLYYINGEKVAEMKDNTMLNMQTTNLPLTIGNNQAQNFNFKGKIDEAQIYNSALTGTEINDLYRSFMPAPTDEVAYWKLNVNGIDETGTNDGTLMYGDASLFVEGVSGGALQFNADADNDTTHVLVADDPSIDFDSTQSFSVSLFLKVDDLVTGRIFVKGSSGKNDPDFPLFNGKRYEMYLSNGRIRWAVDDDVKKAQLSVDNAADYMNLNGWNHLVGVRNR